MSSNAMSQARWPQPFSGAPPIPTGYNVNPQVWQAGQWQPNPRFNWNQHPSSQVSSTSWIPGAAWAHQGGASHNPYKRVPKPPSAEYLASELSDNPLGLTNMIPREELYGPGVDGAPPETPWIWNPRTLDDNSTRPTRQASGSARHASEPPPSSFERLTSTSSASTAAAVTVKKYDLPDINGPLQRPRMYQTSTQAPSSSTSASAYAAASSHNRASAPNDPSPTVNDPTSSRTLRTTFSTRIVRTPDHYRGSGGPDNTNTLARSNTMPSIDSVTSSMERLAPSASTNHSRSVSQSHASSSRHSASTPSMSGVTMFVDEPSSMLSPLVIDDIPISQSAKPLGRNHTAPALFNGLSSIPETPTSSSRDQRHHHHFRASRPSSQQTTPVAGTSSKVNPHHDLSNGSYFSRSTSQGTSSASAAAAASSNACVTPPNSSSVGSVNLNTRPANPLPTPPRVVEVSRYSSPAHSGTTSRASSNVGSSSTVIYNTTTGHGSSSTSYNVIPASSPVPVTSTSASASAAAAASVSPTRSSSRTRERERSRSRPPDRTIQPAPEGVRSNESSARSRDSGIQFAPEGMRANPSSRSRNSSLYHVSEDPKNSSYSDMPHFPLPAPPESFLIERKRQEQQKQHHQSTYQNSQRSPQSNPNPSPQRSPQPPASARPQHSPNHPSQPPQPPQSSSRNHSPNPSPNVPQRTPYPSPYSTSSSQPSPAHGYGQAHGQSRSRVGYWNVRGDHLTESNHIVYAPPHQVYPSELREYPGEFQGYRDHHGNFKKFEVGRPELEESLPRLGKPAVRPYESFIKYI